MSATPRTQSIFNDLVKQNYGHASIEVAIKEVEQLENELAEARADADHWKSECNALQRMVHDARAEIDGLTLMATNASMEPARRLIQKNKELHAVIEQMREALEIAYKYLHAHAERTKDKYVIKDLLTVKAAIAAAKGET